MKDLETPDDVHLMVRTFYQRVREDEQLGPIFDGVAQVDWDEHLPIMFTFWESLLLHTSRYRNNALEPHLQLFQKIPFEPELMQRWLHIFHQTVDDLFQGAGADKAKRFSEGIAHNLDRQIQKKQNETACGDGATKPRIE